MSECWRQFHKSPTKCSTAHKRYTVFLCAKAAATLDDWCCSKHKDFNSKIKCTFKTKTHYSREKQRGNLRREKKMGGGGHKNGRDATKCCCIVCFLKCVSIQLINVFTQKSSTYTHHYHTTFSTSLRKSTFEIRRKQQQSQ